MKNHGRWFAVLAVSIMLLAVESCSKKSLPSEARVLRYDTTAVYRAVQDGSGAVWAVGPSELYRWRNKGWRPAPIQGLKPLELWQGPNGGVLVFCYVLSTGRNVFAWRRANRIRLLTEKPWTPQPVLPSRPMGRWVGAARSGIVMLTGSVLPDSGRFEHHPPSLFRLAMNGTIHLLWRFSAGQYSPFRRSKQVEQLYWPLNVTRDATGKIWIWCGWVWKGLPDEAALEGFVVTDGKKVEYHRVIPGLGVRHVSSLDVWDQSHLVAAAFGDGLYLIDTTTLHAHRIPDPQPGSFRFVQKVFRAGADHYVLTQASSFARRFVPKALPGPTLWRLRDNRWQRVIAHTNPIPGPGLATAGVFWLGSSGHGLSFVPHVGAAREIDRREGFPLAYIRSLFRLTNGDILAMGGPSQTRSVEFKPASLFRHPAASTGFSVQPSFRSLQPDRNRYFWAILPHGALGEWNGVSWIRHPLPPAINPCHIGGLDVDTRGRVWMFPACCGSPTNSLMAFFDPRYQRWTVSSGYQLAIQRERQHLQFLHPSDDPMRPLYGSHSQIVFQGACGEVNYFDGLHWRVWNDRQLPGSSGLEVFPFFDKTGRLAFNTIRATTWQWTPGAGWKQTVYEPIRVFRSTSAPQSGAPLMPPAGCRSPRPSSLVVDSVGRSWWVANDALYEGTARRCHLVLASSALQPFIDGRQLDRVLIDARGNVFLGTSWPFSNVVLPPSVYNGQLHQNLAEHSGAPRPD